MTTAGWCSSGVRLSRLMTYCASLLWGVLVIAQRDAVSGTSYAKLIRPEHENVWAGVVGTIAAVMLVRMYLRRSSILGRVLHCLLSTFWIYIGYSLYFDTSRIFPTPGSTVPCVIILAVYGFLGDFSGMSRNVARAAGRI